MLSTWSIFQCLESNDAEMMKACQQIESDKNFQPDVTDCELLQLAAQSAGRRPIAILPLHLPSPGRLYQIRIVTREEDEHQNVIYGLSNVSVILVGPGGQMSLHHQDNVIKQDFTKPHPDRSPMFYLNRPSWHPSSSQVTVNRP